ncbi:heme oxygenase 1 [Copidosoma floridanum]|uniref:heme oxygenase 1 n=1 Tax=Copidosoma floridanum TaxID=29053 RepID=UPI0006C99CB1|nr:heme oxygenase 1 [Copidosoma floridanum]
MVNMSDVEEDFCKKMRKTTREIHAVSDAMLNAKLAFGFSNDKVWADGLLVFYEIFRYLEAAMLRLKNTEVGQLRINGLQRTEAFEKDLEFYLGKHWMKNYTPRESVVKYLIRLRELEEKDPLLLMAYIYHLNMGLLSGGIILRKKRQLMQKINPFKTDALTLGNNLTDFGECSIYELKSEMRSRMNEIAKSLDLETKNKLLEEKDNKDSHENIFFDRIIGHIEDLLIEDEFQSIQKYYLNKYWNIFEPVEENKLIYMEIFNEYNKDIESYLDRNLKKIVPNFSMDYFINELQKRRSELEGEVFEVLSSFTDFLAFKELILDYRAVQEGKVQDLSSGIVIKHLS